MCVRGRSYFSLRTEPSVLSLGTVCCVLALCFVAAFNPFQRQMADCVGTLQSAGVPSVLWR